MYLSPVGVADPAEIEARVPEFMERAGYYFGNWDTLYDAWMVKIKGVIAELEADRVHPAPAPRGHVGDHRGQRHTARRRGCSASTTSWSSSPSSCGTHHFEFLNLGYAAYLDFFGFCKQVWPSIPDQAIAKMVAGIDVDLFRPDEELKKLAQLAVDLGVGDRISSDAAGDPRRHGRRRAPASSGPTVWEEAHHPWFNFSSGSGFYHSDKVWADYPDIPMNFIESYVDQAAAGRVAGPSGGGRRGRARPDRRGVLRADRRRRDPRDLRGQARAGPHRVPVRREPQLLRRALGHVAGLAQDARARPDPRGRRTSSRRPTTSSCSAATRCRTRSSTTSTAGPSACRRAARSTGAGRSRAARAS